MEGRYPKGILLILTDCGDRAEEAGLNSWYKEVFLPRVTASGTLRHPNRYRNTAEVLGADKSRYMDILETDSGDLGACMAEFDGILRQLVDSQRMHPAMETQLTAVFRATGPEFRHPSRTDEITGLMVLLSNCGDESKDKEFNDWYNTIHIPHVVGSGRYHTAYRYEAIDLVRSPGRYLAIYETDDADPGKLAADMARERPQWIDKGLYSPDIERVMRSAYTLVRL